MALEKQLARQDADYSINPGNNNETSIKVTDEILHLLLGSLPDEDKVKTSINFYIYKEDFVKSACGIISSLPLLDKHGHLVPFSLGLCNELLSNIDIFFGDKTVKLYNAELVYYKTRSSCLQGFEPNFNIRAYTVESWSSIVFSKKGDDIHMRLSFSKTTAPIVTSKHPVISTLLPLNEPLQQIFYGAPGTGKSHTIKENTENYGSEYVFRTTFHPDSDYSTFVGAYKPTMKSGDKLLSYSELIDKLSTIKTQGHTYPCQKFAAKYWRSVKDLSVTDTKSILDACGFPESMYAEIGKGIAIGEDLASKNSDAKIVYEFVPQTFTKAYTAAWNTEKPVFLIIEEINRGNCAQIFGDLFQLLDRKDGESEYPIDADADLASHIARELANSTREITEDVRSGRLLKLPSNLYIWATMNTSDQSLFPIDSAFKRRWEWKYSPIKNHDEENYKLVIGTKTYDWWGFLEKINQVIDDTTSSEDKKLGYFFAKSDDKVVNAEKFVGKVLFYLWNDVFKNYGFDHAVFGKGENKNFAFSDFFEKGGKPHVDMVNAFLSNLDEKIDGEHSFLESDNNADATEEA